MFRKTLIALPTASAVIAASFLGAPSAATVRAGEASWGHPTAISVRGWSDYPAVAVDAAGNTTAVWTQGRAETVVKAARRPAGGVWQQPVTIGVGYGALVGADARGDVTVVWEQRGSPHRIMSARRPAGGGWSDPITLSEIGTAGDFGAWNPRLAVSRAGAVVVSWDYVTQGDYFGARRAEAVYRPVRGRWTTPHLLFRTSLSYSGTELAVAIDARGNVTVVFVNVRGRVWAVRRVVGHGWLSPVRISPNRPQGSGRVDVSVDARGDATAIWYWGLTRMTASRPLSGGWSTPVLLPTPGGPVALGMDDAGTALLGLVGEHGWVRVRSKPLHGLWGRPTTIVRADGRYRGDPRLVLNPRGDTLLTWRQATSGSGYWQSSYRPRGGSWGSPERFAGGDTPNTAMYRNGNAIAVWAPYDEGVGRVWARTMTASQ